MNDIFSNVPIDLVSHVIATNANVYNKLIADRNDLLEKLNEKERQLKALFDTNEKLRTGTLLQSLIFTFRITFRKAEEEL
jgi:hypothetical protein